MADVISTQSSDVGPSFWTPPAHRRGQRETQQEEAKARLLALAGHRLRRIILELGRSSGSSELGRLVLVRPLQRLIVIVGLAQLARPLQRLRRMVGQHLALLLELAQPQQLILRLVRPLQRLSEISTPSTAAPAAQANGRLHLVLRLAPRALARRSAAHSEKYNH